MALSRFPLASAAALALSLAGTAAFAQLPPGEGPAGVITTTLEPTPLKFEDPFCPNCDCRPASRSAGHGPAHSPLAVARLSGADGTVRGQVEMLPAAQGVDSSVRAEDLAPGAHGLHVHANGSARPVLIRPQGGSSTSAQRADI